MSNEELLALKSFKRRLLLPVLLLGHFLITTFTVSLGVLLVDVSSSFKVSIGTASQLSTLTLVTGLFMGFAMGILAIRFRHKALFLFGTVTYSVGALGCFYAPNFPTMLITQLFFGIGAPMVSVMIFALIGEFFPLQNRGSMMGLVWSTTYFAFATVAPLAGFIANIAGWRSILLWFIFPTAIACLIAGWLVIPSTLHHPQASGKSPYLEAFKRILSNKSAMACVVSTALLFFFATIPTYVATFYRVDFGLPRGTVALFAIPPAVGGIFGAAIGGRLVNRYGRKPLTVTAAFISGVLAVLFAFMSNVWVAFALQTLSASFAAVAVTGLYSLILEQIPEFTASMMSVNGSFRYIGGILGVAVGGLVLNSFGNNFQILMPIFAASNIALAPIVIFFAKDPTKPPSVV